MGVRIATPDDAEAIERIRTDTWRAAYQGLLPAEVLDRLDYDGTRRRQTMATMPSDRFVLVAEHGSTVVGFVKGGPSRIPDATHGGEIYALYVLPSHQGHGHGSALLRAGARECLARRWQGMLVWVLRDNWPARRFYEVMGGRHLRDRDEEREIEGVIVTEAAYAWDDVTSLATWA